MRAYPSGFQAALQGLSDTLGGTAEFQRESRTIQDRHGLAQRELDQRMLEEQRRQKIYDLQLREAERKIAAEDAQRAYQQDRAQGILQESQDELFQQMLGQKPTIAQGRKLQRLERLSQHLAAEGADPKQLIDDFEAQEKGEAAASGLEQFAQELTRTGQETLQDPADQQQLAVIVNGILQGSQMTRGGQLKADDVMRLIEHGTAAYQKLQTEAGKRQQELENIQGTIAEFDTRMQTMRPGDPRRQKLGEMKQLVARRMLDPDDAGKILAGQDLGIPEARMTEFLDLVKEMQAADQPFEEFLPKVQYGRPVGTDKYAAVREEAPQMNGQPVAAPAQAQASVPRGALVRLRDAVKAAQSPEEIDALAAELGIQQLSPEEKAFVLGG